MKTNTKFTFIFENSKQNTQKNQQNFPFGHIRQTDINVEDT